LVWCKNKYWTSSLLSKS